MLLLERRHHRHHRFDKAGALRALGPKAPLAPEHPWPNRPLGGVVRGLHPFVTHERPQGLPQLQRSPGRYPPSWAPHRSGPRPAAAPLRAGRATYTWPRSSGPASRRGPDATSGPSDEPAPAGPRRSPESAHHARSWLRYRAAGAPNRAAAARRDTRYRRSSDPSPTPPEPFPQELLRHLATARPPHHKDRHPGGDHRPQPGPLPPLAPARFVHICRRLGLHIGPRLGHRLGYGLDRRVLQVRDRPHAQRDAEQILQDALGGPLGHVIRPRTPRRDGLHPRPEAPPWARQRAPPPVSLRHRRGRPTGAVDTRSPQACWVGSRSLDAAGAGGPPRAAAVGRGGSARA